MKKLQQLQQYAKFIAAILGAALTAGAQALPDGIQLWVTIVIAALTAAGVYAVPNTTPATSEDDPDDLSINQDDTTPPADPATPAA